MQIADNLHLHITAGLFLIRCRLGDSLAWPAMAGRFPGSTVWYFTPTDASDPQISGLSEPVDGSLCWHEGVERNAVRRMTETGRRMMFLTPPMGRFAAYSRAVWRDVSSQICWRSGVRGGGAGTTGFGSPPSSLLGVEEDALPLFSCLSGRGLRHPPHAHTRGVHRLHRLFESVLSVRSLEAYEYDDVYEALAVVASLLAYLTRVIVATIDLSTEKLQQSPGCCRVCSACPWQTVD
jgi:hypothetical protein